jgi:hypothetical protein
LNWIVVDAASRFPSAPVLELKPAPAPEMLDVQLPSATAGEAIPATSRTAIAAVSLFLILISRQHTTIESAVTASTPDMAPRGTALHGCSCDPPHARPRDVSPLLRTKAHRWQAPLRTAPLGLEEFPDRSRRVLV